MSIIWGIPYLLYAWRYAISIPVSGPRTHRPRGALLMPLVYRCGQLDVLFKNIIWIAVFGVVEFGIPWYLMATAENTHEFTDQSVDLRGSALLGGRPANPPHRGTISFLATRGLLVGALGVALLVGLDLKGGSITWIGLMMIICHWLHARTDILG